MKSGVSIFSITVLPDFSPFSLSHTYTCTHTHTLTFTLSITYTFSLNVKQNEIGISVQMYIT